MQDYKTSKLGLNETLTTPLQNYDSTNLTLRYINDNVSSLNAGLLSIARTLGSLYKKVTVMEEKREEITPSGDSSVETKAFVRKIKLLEKTQKEHGKKLDDIYELLQKATAPVEEEQVPEVVRTHEVEPIMDAPVLEVTPLDLVVED